MTAGDPLGPVFTALADDVRRAVLERLSAGGTVTPSGLARELPVTRQAVSKHLAVLEDAGLVSRRREGRETHYRLAAAPLDDALAWMASVGGRWDDRLGRLEGVVRRRREAGRPGREAAPG